MKHYWRDDYTPPPMWIVPAGIARVRCGFCSTVRDEPLDEPLGKCPVCAQWDNHEIRLMLKHTLGYLPEVKEKP